MYFRNVILFGIILFHMISIAQDNSTGKTEKDYQKFKETLEVEIENSKKDTTKSNFQILHPADLPDWLFKLPTSNQNTIYSIGISDPGMEEEKAFKLADLRAKAIIASLTHSKVTFIIDSYSNEKIAGDKDEFTTRYENLFSILSALSTSSSNFETVNQHYTSFGEAIVLVKYNRKISKNNTDNIQLEISSYEVERQKFNKFELEEKFELTASIYSALSEDKEGRCYYSFHSLNNLFEISSKYQEENYQFPYYSFKYQGQSADSLPLHETSINNKLNYGLWKAYIETLVQKIFDLSLASAVVIKRVGDDYTSESQDFSREVTEATKSFRINNFIVFNNRLSVELDYLD